MAVTKNMRGEQNMQSRSSVLVWGLLTSVLLSLGCGGYTNDSTPEIVVTEEMLAEMGEEEAERQERYRKLAAEKGMTPPPASTDGGPMGVAMQKRQEAREKRASARQK